MIRAKPLEWEGDFAHLRAGGFYHLESSAEGLIVLYYHTGSSKTGVAVADNIPELERAAQRQALGYVPSKTDALRMLVHKGLTAQTEGE